ncbi:hypothetical protein NLJ89_g7467 [Agrocybe chaxingu]|uniref:RNA helicase n=1 Tax=Agrocybe chaxingu TaxID=84603 RepID=A0A9W8JWM0_9AGAR|nr:hypothetical protein NLJ89_g7467 [Agrocybe chaxingu]
MRTGRRHRSKSSAFPVLEPFDADKHSRRPRSDSDDVEPFPRKERKSYLRGTLQHTRHPAAAPQKLLPSPLPTSSRKVHSPFDHHHKIPVLSEEEVVPFFEDRVTAWATDPVVLDRLQDYGIPDLDGRKLLNAFEREVRSGELSKPTNYTSYGLQRFAQPHDRTSVDVIYSTIFFSWASRPANQEHFQNQLNISPDTLYTIERLMETTDRWFPADEFPEARMIHRKIIMHVGPTNSGKTHHALRALAAARTGVYAGPLRLLAHEIWERLNTGQIVPLGVEEPAPTEGGSARSRNPAYARPCNMITGEEQKIVGTNVPLLSSTVEMLSFVHGFDVAVIDEIQMISDPDRGAGWTNAVLGIRASEVHLCGEETAVPVVQELLKHTGDEVIVRRYERLTPLVVEEESLNGDLTKVRKGDCIVTFSRSNIFGLKRVVEEKTGMRCAVVYGRLPPEVRSEQAALFNDPDSGYDVIIGSDAIGMGLNLRIKRVIFEATAKYEGIGKMTRLSVSSVKQIAGRAGRYGQHQSPTDLGGFVTTIHPDDLPYLRECIAQPYQSLPYARVGLDKQLLGELSSCLPPNSPMNTLLEAPMFIGRLPAYARYADKFHLTAACTFIDYNWRDMSNEDRVLLLFAPVPWRDFDTTNVIKRLLLKHKTSMSVNLAHAIKSTNFMETLQLMEGAMQAQARGEPSKVSLSTTSKSLVQLESFHKVIVFYVWMSFRNPVVYADYDNVMELKERLEVVLNWCLLNLSKALNFSQKVTGPLVSKLKVAHQTKHQLRKESLLQRLDQASLPPSASLGSSIATSS